MYIQAFATVKCDRDVAYSRTQYAQHVFVLCAIYIVYTVYSAAQKFVNSEQKILFWSGQMYARNCWIRLDIECGERTLIFVRCSRTFEQYCIYTHMDS